MEFDTHVVTRFPGDDVLMLVRTGAPGRGDRRVEREIINEYKTVDVSGHTVLDIGAHIGYFVIWALRSGAAHVACVEPDPVSFELLQKNLEQNSHSFSGTYELIEAACVARELPDDKSFVTLFQKANAQTCNSIVIPNGPNGGTEVKVPAVQWKDLHDDCKYDTVKIDCESLEYELLLNGGVPGHVKHVAVEFHLGRKLFREELAPRVCRQFEQEGWSTTRVPVLGPNKRAAIAHWSR